MTLNKVSNTQCVLGWKWKTVHLGTGNQKQTSLALPIKEEFSIFHGCLKIGKLKVQS